MNDNLKTELASVLAEMRKEKSNAHMYAVVPMPEYIGWINRIESALASHGGGGEDVPFGWVCEGDLIMDKAEADEARDAGATVTAVFTQRPRYGAEGDMAIHCQQMGCQCLSPQPRGEEYPEAVEVCAQAYQVVGCLLDDLGILGTPRADKILDNLSQFRLVHKDVIPWESVKPRGEGMVGEAMAADICHALDCLRMSPNYPLAFPNDEAGDLKDRFTAALAAAPGEGSGEVCSSCKLPKRGIPIHSCACATLKYTPPPASQSAPSDGGGACPPEDLLTAYDDAVNDLSSDYETGWNANGCRAVYARRIRRIRALILRRLTAAPGEGGGA